MNFIPSFSHQRWIRVAAAILFNGQGEILIAQRQSEKSPGKWEFPGGKIEPGESAKQALVRELDEEVGVTLQESALQPLIQLHYAYADYALNLNFFTANSFTGIPYGKEGQPVRWISITELENIDFLPTNKPVLQALQLPDQCLITPEPEANDGFLQTLEKTLQQGNGLLQFRAKSLPPSTWQALAAEVIEIAHQYHTKVVLNSPVEALSNADGLHLTSQQLMKLTERPAIPAHQTLSASCHNADELARAKKIGADFVFLSPVKATRSHPQASPLGWERFQQLVSSINMPVYALGGMSKNDRLTAKAHGAQGIAAISALWNE